MHFRLQLTHHTPDTFEALARYYTDNALDAWKKVA